MTEPASEQSIFLNALALPTPEERTAYLDEACRDNPALRAEVEALLAAHERLGGGLPPTTGGESAEVVDDGPAPESGGEVGAVLSGRYKLVQQIGEGGMGTVWMAQQTEPVKRLVALKVIKPGMDSRQVLARFEAERQALALMDHPNIARVLDAGTTVTGRPFFVMELVKGVPLTKYCDEHRLTPRERLELFIPVCQAIQHAHQKGVIHRDIKPSNVMVALYDSRPVPKVIDFGVAKATGQQLTEYTLVTGFGTVVGTLEYMSPEQAEINQLDIDTRSDIYSLGVLLYELLTGTTPLERKRLKQAAMLEVLRMIREEEPPRPSTRLSSTEEFASVAAKRGLEPRKLSGLVRGELDWIVMKALEKDRNRRYETANGLARDIERYLHDEPVTACPPSALYRLRKFARRNKSALTTAVLLAVALILTVVVLAISNVLVTGERDQKDQALKDKDDALKDKDDALHKERVALTKAKDQEQRAKENAEKADTQKQEAVKQEKFARRHLYGANMNLADQAKAAGNGGRALTLLESLRPQPGAEDLRQFEWYYLWRLCHLGHQATLRGHHDTIFSVACSADSKTLVSASRDGTVKFWDMRFGNLERTLKGNVQGINAVALSPNGKLLASGEASDTIKLWDVGAGKVLATLQGYSGTWGRSNLAFSPDGKLLAWGALDKSVKLWDVEKKRYLPALPGHNGEVKIVAFSPDGKTVAAAADFGEVKIWDVTTSQQRHSIDTDRLGVLCCAFSPDGKLLATGGAFGTVRLWEWATGRVRSSLGQPSTAVFCVAFSPDGKRVAWGTLEGSVRLWDLATGHARDFGHVGTVRAVAFSPDGKRLISAGDDEVIKLWDAVVEPIPAKPEGENVHCFAHPVFSPDGRTLATGNDNSPVELWDVATGRLRATLRGHRLQVVSLNFSPDGKLLASGSDDRTIRLWDMATRKERAILSGLQRPPYRLAFSPDGKTLASSSDDATIRLWDVDSGQERTSLQTLNLTLGGSLAWSPDGKVLASGQSNTENLCLWDVATGQVRARLPGGYAPERFSADGKTLATSGQSGMVFWDLATGKASVSLNLNFNANLPLHCSALSPDWKTLAVTNAAGTIKLWDMETGQERGTIKAADDRVYHVEFSPDGKVLALVAHVGTVKFLRTATEQEVSAQSGSLDPREERGREELSRGDQLVKERRHQDAEKAYRQAAQLYEELAADFPKIADYWFRGGLARFRLGQWQKAIRDYSETIRLEPDNPIAWNNRATAYGTLGQYDQAFADYAKAIEVLPNQPLYWANRGSTYVRLGQWEKAAADYAKVVELQSQDPQLWYGYALLRAATGDIEGYRRACVDFQARFADAQEPGQVQMLLWTCVLAPDALPNFETVIKRADTAGANQAKNFVLLTTRGAALYRAGWLREAVQQLTEAQAVYKPADEQRQSIAYNWLFLSMAQHRLDHAEEAKTLLAKAVELIDRAQRSATSGQPDNPSLPWNRKLTLQLLRAETEAPHKMDKKRAAFFTRAIEQKRNDPLRWAERGRFYASVGQWKEATPDLLQAAELAKDHLEILADTGRFLSRPEYRDHAIDIYEQALQRWPDNLTLWQARSRLLTAAGGAQEAEADSQKALALEEIATWKLLEREPNNGNHWHALGVIHYRARHWKAAQAAMLKALEVFPRSSSWQWFYLAMIDWQLGKKDRARHWYEQALVWMEKSDSQNQALRRIRRDATALLALPEASAPSKQHVEQHESAIHAAIYTLVLEINPRATWVYLRRSECYAALAQWDKAAADYTQTLSPQTPHETCCQLACTRLLAGDSKGYQQMCKWARERASATTQPLSPYMASRIGILSPQGGIDPAQLVRWAEQAVASQPKCEWFLHTLGAAHYRAGNLDQAIRRCRESLQVAPDWGGRMLNWLILAMCHERLGHTKEARHWLNQAIQWRKDHALQGKGKGEFLSPPGLHPSDWLEFNVLIREAEALVNTPSTQVPDGGPRTRDQKKSGR